MQIVILCGGVATRLRPITNKIPKAMVEIEGRPFLEYQLELLKKNAIKNIVLCIGYKGEQIKKYFGDGRKFGVKIRYSQEKKKLLGTGGALKKASNLLEDIFLVMYGDSYLPFDFQKTTNYFKKFQKLGLMTVYKNLNKYEPSNVVVKGKFVVDYNKKRRNKKMKYIDYGVSIFRKEALKFLPDDRTCGLSLLHKALIKRGELLAYRVWRRFYQVGDFAGLAEFRLNLKRKCKFDKISSEMIE